MGNINTYNWSILDNARAEEGQVTFTYCAKSDGHERAAVGFVYALSNTHVTLFDRVRNNYRVFIMDRIRGKVLPVS